MKICRFFAAACVKKFLSCGPSLFDVSKKVGGDGQILMFTHMVDGCGRMLIFADKAGGVEISHNYVDVI